MKRMLPCALLVAIASVLGSATARADRSLVDADRGNRIRRTLSFELANGHEYSVEAVVSFSELEEARQQSEQLEEDEKLRASIEWARRAPWVRRLFAEARRRGDRIADVVMALVQQSIPYRTSDDPGWLPAMTVGLSGADCDDKSYLAVALLRLAGYDAVLWEVVGGSHMGVGIVLPGARGVHVTQGGKDYVFWEATNRGFAPGEDTFARRYRARLIEPATAVPPTRPDASRVPSPAPAPMPTPPPAPAAPADVRPASSRWLGVVGLVMYAGALFVGAAVLVALALVGLRMLRGVTAAAAEPATVSPDLDLFDDGGLR